MGAVLRAVASARHRLYGGEANGRLTALVPVRWLRVASRPHTPNPPKPSVSLVNSLTRAGVQLAVSPMRGAAALVQGGAAAERRARAALTGSGERVALGAVDALLDRLLAGDALDRVLEHVETTRLVQRVSERMLQDGIAEQVAEQAIAGPELERVIARALESRLPEAVVAHLLEGQALWILVDEIARSPSVTEAITHQGTGFVEQVAGVARDRSRDADAWVERVAQRVALRRRRGATHEGVELSPPASLPRGDGS